MKNGDFLVCLIEISLAFFHEIIQYGILFKYIAVNELHNYNISENNMQRHIPYGIMNYAEFIQEIRYFIDKNSFHRKAGSYKKPGLSPSEKIW